MAVSVGTAKAMVRNFRWEPRRQWFVAFGGNRRLLTQAPPKSQQHLPNKQKTPITEVFCLWRYRWEPSLAGASSSQIPVIRKRKCLNQMVKTFSMAVSVGFEPTVRLRAHNFSRVAPSAARTRYRDQDYLLLRHIRNRDVNAEF